MRHLRSFEEKAAAGKAGIERKQRAEKLQRAEKMRQAKATAQARQRPRTAKPAARRAAICECGECPKCRWRARQKASRAKWDRVTFDDTIREPRSFTASTLGGRPYRVTRGSHRSMIE
jgi:hypothetical protein